MLSSLKLKKKAKFDVNKIISTVKSNCVPTPTQHFSFLKKERVYNIDLNFFTESQNIVIIIPEEKKFSYKPQKFFDN